MKEQSKLDIDLKTQPKQKKSKKKKQLTQDETAFILKFGKGAYENPEPK